MALYSASSTLRSAKNGAWPPQLPAKPRLLRDAKRSLVASIGIEQQKSCQFENERERDISCPDTSSAHAGQQDFKQHRRKGQTKRKHPYTGDFLSGLFPGRQ